MNPMIRKELRQRLREKRAWLLPTLYLLALSSTVAFAYYASLERQAYAWRQGDVQGADIGEAIFLAVIFTQIIVLLLLAPVFSAGGLTIEKEQRTLAGLLTSFLTPAQIWWGKYVAALLYLLLLLASALPLVALSFAFGGVEPWDLVKAVFSTVLVLASLSAVGLFCSALFRRSVHSTAAAYGIVLVLSILTAVAYAIVLSRWQADPSNAGELQPAYVQAPLLLNPVYPFLSLTGDSDFREFAYPVSSWMLFTAMGCLTAAFAMRRIRSGGEEL